MVCTTLQLQIKFCLLCHILLEIEILQQLQYLYNFTILTTNLTAVLSGGLEKEEEEEEVEVNFCLYLSS